MDKVSYALGLSIGNNFQNSGINDLQIEDFVKVERYFRWSDPGNQL